MADQNRQHLDAAESIYLQRELNSIATQTYETQYSENMGRGLVPLITDCAEAAPVYLWSMISRFGMAKLGGDLGDDMPNVEVAKDESAAIIHNLTDSYRYNVLEIMNAARTGTPLDAMRAKAARDTIEVAIDSVLANGTVPRPDGTFASLSGMKGLLNIPNANTATLAAAAANPASKAWIYKTADEIVADVANMIKTTATALKQAGGPEWRKFTLVLPVEQDVDISTRRMGDGASETIKSYLLSKVGAYLTEIVPWQKCDNAGSGGTIDRMALYVKRVEVVGALIPMDFRQYPAQAQNLAYKVPCLARTGGVISRYPIAVTYGDGL